MSQEEDVVKELEKELKETEERLQKAIENFKSSKEGVREKALLDLATCCYGSWKFIKTATDADVRFQDVVYAMSQNIYNITGYSIPLHEWDDIAELMVLERNREEQ